MSQAHADVMCLAGAPGSPIGVGDNEMEWIPGQVRNDGGGAGLPPSDAVEIFGGFGEEGGLFVSAEAGEDLRVGVYDFVVGAE